MLAETISRNSKESAYIGSPMLDRFADILSLLPHCTCIGMVGNNLATSLTIPQHSAALPVNPSALPMCELLRGWLLLHTL